LGAQLGRYVTDEHCPTRVVLCLTFMQDGPLATDVVLPEGEVLADSESGDQEDTGREGNILEVMLIEPLNESALVFLRQVIEASDRLLLLWDTRHSGNQLTLQSPTEQH
jgi:hypothetical protein